MRTAIVEVYSDAPNATVMRHPSRQFPGVLIQGDTLRQLHATAAHVLATARESLDDDAVVALEDLAAHLGELVEHYKTVLKSHAIELPFTDV